VIVVTIIQGGMTFLLYRTLRVILQKYIL